MKFYNKFSVLSLVCVVLSSPLSAKPCTESLKKHAKWLTAGAVISPLVPLYGPIFTAMAVLGHKRVIKDMKRLTAAHILALEIMGEERAWAKKVMDEFYDKLTQAYPQTTLSKQEVIAWLQQINMLEFGKGPCIGIMNGSLKGSLFPERNIDFWKKEHHRIANWENEQRQKKLESEKKKLEAARVRDEKNSLETTRPHREKSSPDELLDLELMLH